MRTSPSSGRSSSATSRSTSAECRRRAVAFGDLRHPRAARSRPSCARRWRPPSAPSMCRPIRSTASSTPAARACATSCGTGAARSAGSRTSSSVPATRTRWRRSCRRRSTADAVVIPFGGGSNISGSLEPPAGRARARSSRSTSAGWTGCWRSTRRRGSRACRPACSGPQLEEQLNARGWTLGHFPDSFAYSTLGGWIATRSSGMQSDKYGDVADLTRAVRVVMPAACSPRARCPRRRPGRACAR